MTGAQSTDGGEPPERRAKRRRRRRKPASTTKRAAERTGAPAGDPQADEKGAGSGKTAGKAGTAKGSGAGKARGRRNPAAPRSKGRGPVQKEVSSGGVVYRRDGDRIEVVLASRRTRRGDLAWGLAKGGVEPGESLEEAAVREVREETGLTAVIEGSLGDTKYFYVWEETRIRKTVHFFLMRHTGGSTDDRDDEMEEVRWFPLDRALKRAAYRGEREVLQRAAEQLG